MWLFAVALFADTLRVHHVSVAPAETLHVVEEGAGEPITLIPGLFGSAFGFRTLVPLLTAAGYRTVIIEPLGRCQRFVESFRGPAALVWGGDR